MNFFYFCGTFLPSWIRIRIRIPNTDPDPLARLNTDPIRIRIQIRIRNPAFIIGVYAYTYGFVLGSVADPDSSDPLVRGADPDPEPSVIKQK